MSQRLITASLISFMAFPLHAMAEDLPNPIPNNIPQKIEGNWTGPGGVLKTEPCPKDAKTHCIKVVSGNNTEDSMADLVGQIIIKDLVKSATPNTWEGLFIDDGKDAPAKLTLKSDNIIQFSVCMIGLLCEEQTYTRIETSK
jgi:uncharacterized protein (DUF2147 family)